MKKFLLFFLVASCIYSFATTAQVTANSLNVREAPSKSAQVVGKLEQNERVQVGSCENGFCEVSNGSISGFASAKFLEKISTTETSIQETSYNRGSSDDGESSFFYSEADVGQSWKIGTVVVIVLAYIIAIVGFILRNLKVGISGATVAVLLTIAVAWLGLAGFVSMVWNALIVIVILAVLYVAALIYSGGTKSNSKSPSQPKHIEIISATLSSNGLLRVTIENESGSQRVLESSYGGEIYLLGYTSSSVTVKWGSNVIVRRLRGNSLWSASLSN